MPFVIIASFLGGTGDKYTGSGGGGCYLADQYFRDTSLAAQPEQVLTTLKSKYPQVKNVEKYIREILEEGKKRNINPAVPIGIWHGENGFDNPEKAFGFGYHDSGTIPGALNGDKEERWKFQLNGVYRVINDAIENRGYYTKPAGANIMTRLFYNYASAMRKQYDISGQRWDESYSDKNDGNPYYARLNVIKLLVPSQVICETKTRPNVVIYGDYACPMDEKLAQKGSDWGDVIKTHSYKTGTYPGHEGLDIYTPVGTPILSASDGQVVKTQIGHKSNDPTYSVTSVTVQEKEGVFWYYTHLTKIEVRKGQKVAKGTLIGTSGTANHSPHLHIGISKRLNDRGTGGGYNWTAWYYPYQFLRFIPCLNPPPADTVGFP